MQPVLRPGWDVLVIARPSIVSADHRAIGSALGRLLARGGVMAEQGGEMGSIARIDRLEQLIRPYPVQRENQHPGAG